MNKSIKLTFFGSGPLATKCLEFLIEKFDIGAVITKSKPAYHKEEAPIETLAANHKLPIYYSNNKAQLDQLFRRNNQPLNCGIVIDYGVIIEQKIIDKFKFGIINSHFSLLPEWRGPDPITYALLSGQPSTGVSLMLINSGMDTGKLIAQIPTKIKKQYDNTILSKTLIKANNKLILDNLNKYLEGRIIPYNQPPTVATYSNKIAKNNGEIVWQKPASTIEREIRAYNGWPRSYTTLNGLKFIIVKAVVSKCKLSPGKIQILDNKKLLIGCGVDSIEILEAIPLNKNIMDSKSLINGYKNKLVG